MNELKKFDEATDKLARAFVDKYFYKEYEEDEAYYWVGSQGEDREVLAVGDYYFNLEDIVSFLRYKYTEDEMFEYYDYLLKKNEKEENPINIRNWKKLYKKK